MSVLLALNESAAASIQRRLLKSETVVCSLDLVQIARELEHGAPLFVVVDPAEVAPEFFASLVEIVGRSASTLLVWTKFEPEAVTHVVTAARGCPVDVAFREAEETRRDVTARIAHMKGDSLGRQLLRRYAENLADMPERSSLAVVGVLSGHVNAHSVADISPETGDRRTFERHLKQAGFVGASNIVQVSRLLRAREMLLERDSTVESAAASAGYGSSRALQAASMRLAGCAPRELVNMSRTERIVECLANRLLRGTG